MGCLTKSKFLYALKSILIMARNDDDLLTLQCVHQLLPYIVSNGLSGIRKFYIEQNVLGELPVPLQAAHPANPDISMSGNVIRVFVAKVQSFDHFDWRSVERLNEVELGVDLIVTNPLGLEWCDQIHRSK